MYDWNYRESYANHYEKTWDSRAGDTGGRVGEDSRILKKKVFLKTSSNSLENIFLSRKAFFKNTFFRTRPDGCL